MPRGRDQSAHRRGAPPRLAWALALAMTLAAPAAGCSGTPPEPPTVTPAVAGASAAPSPTPTPTPAATPTPEPEPETQTAARRFLAALSEGRYDEMWGMLAGAARQAWRDDPAAFAAFLDAKFGPAALTFSLGAPAPPARWQDPDTAAAYGDAVSVPLRLQANGQDAPEFSLTPLVLAGEEGEWRVAGAGPAARRAPVLLPGAPSQRTLDVPILAYHHVRPDWPPDMEGRTLTVKTDAFAEQLAHLRDQGYRSVTLAELANALFYGLALPPKPVVLTFDDGYDDAFAYAFPLLQQYGFTGSFALPTGLVGGPGYLTWEQARQMAEAGMELASHTVSHANLGSLTAEQVAAEVRESKAALEAQTGRPAQALVYPYGMPFAGGSAAAQQTVVEALRQAGYVVAVTNPLSGEPPNVSQRGDLPYQLRRVMVSGGLPVNRFAARLEGRDGR